MFTKKLAMTSSDTSDPSKTAAMDVKFREKASPPWLKVIIVQNFS
jgi:hypothetical protein